MSYWLCSICSRYHLWMADASWLGFCQKPSPGVSRLEPYGLAILIGLLIILPMLGAQLGIDLNLVSHLIAITTGVIIDAIVHFTGNS